MADIKTMIRQPTVGRGPDTVKVWPATDTIRRAIKHPNGMRFRAKLDQEVEWPRDQFTLRRIASGAVRTDGPASGDAPAPDPKLNARQQAAARRPKPKEEQPKQEAAKPAPRANATSQTKE